MRLLFFSVSSGGSSDDSSSGGSSDDSSSGGSRGNDSGSDDSGSMLMLDGLEVQGLNRTVRLLQRLL
jgi:hypothetical protein